MCTNLIKINPEKLKKSPDQSLVPALPLSICLKVLRARRPVARLASRDPGRRGIAPRPAPLRPTLNSPVDAFTPNHYYRFYGPDYIILIWVNSVGGTYERIL